MCLKSVSEKKVGGSKIAKISWQLSEPIGLPMSPHQQEGLGINARSLNN